VKDVKEFSVKWTHWDSNRECLKFDKVSKPSSSTIITANNYHSIVLGNALSAIHNKIHHASYQILSAKRVLSLLLIWLHYFRFV